jgi:hypothetical protein
MINDSKTLRRMKGEKDGGKDMQDLMNELEEALKKR